MKIVITLLVMLFSYTTFSQSLPSDIDKQYFILGTLNDYCGRNLSQSVSNRVDFYFADESPLVPYIDSILHSEKFKTTVDTFKGSLSINCNEEAAQLNEFYDFKGDSIGYLKKILFPYKDSIKMYSFLLGAYLRYGQQKDSSYYLEMANSPSKITICKKLLLQAGCTNIRYEEWVDNIPSLEFIYFIPTKTLQAYFDSVTAIKKEMTDFTEHNKKIRQKKIN